MEEASDVKKNALERASSRALGANAIFSKRTHIELGVSLALLWMRQRVEEMDHLSWCQGDGDGSGEIAEVVRLQMVNKMTANDNIEAIMQTAKID